jgi:hypothetical protein
LCQKLWIYKKNLQSFHSDDRARIPGPVPAAAFLAFPVGLGVKCAPTEIPHPSRSLMTLAVMTLGMRKTRESYFAFGLMDIMTGYIF